MQQQNSTKLTSRAGNWVLNFVGQPSSTRSEDNPSEIPCIPTPKSVVRHPEFFFEDVLVAIQIEGTLFNVHKYQLAKSEVFSDMFQVPNPEANTPEGSSPDNPIIINGVAASDFASLLRVLYAGQFSSNQPIPDAPLIVPAFRLANMFNFSELRAFLLSLAEKNLNDVDKIVFAREFDIKEWLVPAHLRLCQREEPLGTEEARKLQVDSAVMISRMREQYRTRNSTAILNSDYCQSCAGWQYGGSTFFTCQSCSVRYRTHFLQYKGPATMVAKDTTNDTTLEVEVKKWVEDSFTPRVL